MSGCWPRGLVIMGDDVEGKRASTIGGLDYIKE